MDKDKNTRKQTEDNEIGISNRGIDQEKPAQDYVMDSIEGMELDGQRDDASMGDRLHDKSVDIGRNLDPYVDDDDSLTLTPEELSGGARQIDSKDGIADHSHH